MNDSIAYGGMERHRWSHEGFGDHVWKHTHGDQVKGMELMPDWAFVQSGGRLKTDFGLMSTEGHKTAMAEHYGGMVSGEEIAALKEAVDRSGKTHRALCRELGFSKDALRRILHGDMRARNRTYLAFKKYFGLEAA